MKCFIRALIAGMIGAAAASLASAQGHAEAGISDGEIVLGNIVPYSGPASVYSVYGKVFEGYFKRVNENGGVNGRVVRLISYDDSYSPPKTVEQARRLVENDEVFALFGVVGTPTNAAIMKYMNAKKTPQLFAASGSSLFTDPEHFPWTIGFQANYRAEGRMYGAYVLAHRPDARVAVLYQDDDFGKDLLKGLTEGLGGKASEMIISTASYDVRVPSVDSQLVQLKASGADVLFDFTTPKFSTQAVRKAAELQWRPLQILASVGSHVGSVLKPAGLENAKGIMTGRWVKDPSDPSSADDKGIAEWRLFMQRYYPTGDTNNGINIIAYVLAQAMEHVLRMCGDDMSRGNLLKQATSMTDFKSDLLIDGVRLQSSPKDYFVVRDLQMSEFDGSSYRPVGQVVEMSR